MRIKFKYNGIEYYPKNPDKKLKQLGIIWDDVEIIENEPKKEPIELLNTRLYIFKNEKTNETILSIYDSLGDYIIDKEDYKFIGTNGF